MPLKIATKSNPFLGPWRIVEMELWELEDIDMLGRGYIRFDRDGTGEFRFIAVQGGMDCRVAERDGGPIVEFSWAGYEEMDPTCGRGWANWTPMAGCAVGCSFIWATTPLLPLCASALSGNRARTAHLLWNESGSATRVMRPWHHEEPGEVAHLGQIAVEFCDHASVAGNGLQRRYRWIAPAMVHEQLSARRAERARDCFRRRRQDPPTPPASRRHHSCGC